MATKADLPAVQEADRQDGELEETTSEPSDIPIASHLSRATVFTAVVEESFLETHKSHDMSRQTTRKPSLQKSRRCTPEVRAFGISCFLFSLITVIQVFAAHLAHSQALMMDCISMGVDAFTYLGNILVECRKRDGGQHVCSQLVVVALSMGLLCYFTAQAMAESWNTVLLCEGKLPEVEEEGVNGWITLGFALGGVAFDIACLLEFYKSNKKTGCAKSVNMFTAFLHVSADFLRSTATLVMSLLILFCGVDSNCIDAYTGLFIGFTIFAGAFFGFFKWLKLALSLCRLTEFASGQ